MNKLTESDIQTRNRLRKKRKSGDLPKEMKPYLAWLEGNRKPKIPESHRRVFNQARDRVNAYLEQGHTVDEAINYFDSYPTFIYRLRHKDFSRIPYQKAKDIARSNRPATNCLKEGEPVGLSG